MVSRLRISVILPEDSAWNQVELKLLVDDLDMIEAAFDRAVRARIPTRCLGRTVNCCQARNRTK